MNSSAWIETAFVLTAILLQVFVENHHKVINRIHKFLIKRPKFMKAIIGGGLLVIQLLVIFYLYKGKELVLAERVLTQVESVF